MKNILYDIYSRWEHDSITDTEYNEINKKIKAEREYFERLLTPEDAKRLLELENLYGQSESFEELEAYIAGIKFGVKLMCAVFHEE